MPRVCEVCGKKTEVGYKYARRGLAKYKGGVGKKVTGRTKRRFLPNFFQTIVHLPCGRSYFDQRIQ